ncbi:type II toxin-antitoxin system HicA family toxin [uncultured Sutterella sp.]|mgnify:CR=1 FL=1|uniref:type II toxin-antitoxin system HicA family toxin n=1 Tax=uncultured Sutterella sp. TaxID=286133 RepID=UPI00261005F4|nr:type II toxin-antitoxin system HicA family toxin [uncultured Sutterella sp.]
MTSAEMIKLLERLGWKVVRQSGSHIQLKKDGVEKLITIPHPRKDLKKGLVEDAKKIAGIK